MADLRANPTLNRMQTDEAFNRLRSENPGLGRMMGQAPVDIRMGNVRGPGFAETFPPGETGPPNKPAPGNKDNLRIEMRKGRFGDIEAKKDLLIGELLHQVGGIKEDGSPFNPKFTKLKRTLIGSLTPEQEAEERFFYNQAVQSGQTGSNFDSFESYMMTTRGDAIIRGDIVPSGLTHPKEQAAYMRRDGTGFLSKEQVGIMDKIRGLLK
jgi:hypothetical protein